MATSIRAVIFDFDGVIADTELLHFKAFEDAFEKAGITITEDDYNDTYIALSDRDAVRVAFQRAGLCLSENMRAAVMQNKKRRFDERSRAGTPLFPGVADCIRALSAEVPIAVGSGALHDEIVAILDRHGLADRFVGVVAADMVTISKPDPETYRRVCELINEKRAPDPPAQPNECVVIEDTDIGIQAAKAAGMRVVGVTNTYAADRLREADAVIDTLEGVTVETLGRLLCDQTAAHPS